MTKPVITAFDWVPWFARGLVRDLRVRWALEEVGQDYDVRYLPQGAQKAPPHCALQPFGQVPTYEQDGLTLFESGAIVQHIAESHGGLLPDDAGGRARAIEWMFAALNTSAADQRLCDRDPLRSAGALVEPRLPRSSRGYRGGSTNCRGAWRKRMARREFSAGDC